MKPVLVTPEVEEALHDDAAVAIGVSGGKDSTALAFAVVDYLDRIRHRGPCVLVHADLGRVEWRDSMRVCERLADRLGLELVVVRRAAGDMLDRWETRWANNVRRYAELSCVKLILPWSTPAMRFCTSEMKVAVICRELVSRFPDRTIVSASGIRRQESPNRAKAPIVKDQAKLKSTRNRTTGFDWHPILDWSRDDVLACHEAHGFPLHEAYTRFGASRVSCVFCVMSNRGDLLAASSAEENADLYRAMVDLELRSTFAFQSAGWLADVAPRLLADGVRANIAGRKAAAAERERVEAMLPCELLYVKGWPERVPSYADAAFIAGIRRVVGEAVGIEVEFTDPASVIARYEQLIQEKT